MTKAKRSDIKGVEWIIFDLDDTLIRTCKFYYEVREVAYAFLSGLGLCIDNAEKILEQIEFDQVKRFGFTKERFPISLGLLYKELVRQQGYASGITYNLTHRELIEKIGWTVYEKEHPIVEDAEFVLGVLKYAGYNLMLFTKGDKEVQSLKIDRSGLGKYFYKVVISNDKRLEDYQRLIAENNLTPNQCVMIGDSVKSDINPSRSVGMHAIHIPSPDVWSYEIQESKHDYFVLKDIKELINFFNAGWAEDNYKVYKNNPNTDLFQCVRDGVYDFAPSALLERLMPDCPSKPYYFWNNDDPEWTQERFSVYSYKPGLDYLIDPAIKDKQLSHHAYMWPMEVTEEMFKSREQTIASVMCYNCANKKTCEQNNIINGIKST